MESLLQRFRYVYHSQRVPNCPPNGGHATAPGWRHLQAQHELGSNVAFPIWQWPGQGGIRRLQGVDQI